MTQEQKAKAYDKAIKVANKYKDTHIMFHQIKDEIFPELAESEDEKIRKAMIEGFEDYQQPDAEWRNGIKVKDCIAWLEKQGSKKLVDDLTQQEAMDIAVAKCFEQGEQKPAAWSEEDERNLQWIIDEIEANKHDAKEYEWKTYDRFLNWLKSIKDRVQPHHKQEWSDADERRCQMLQKIICHSSASVSLG